MKLPHVTSFLLAALAGISFVTPMEAAVVYTYSGPSFTTVINNNTQNEAFGTSDHLTASFSLSDYLPANFVMSSYFTQNITPLSWTMSDGTHTNSSAIGTLVTIAIETDAGGAIRYWDMFSIQPYAQDVNYTTRMRTFLYNQAFIGSSYPTGTDYATDTAIIYPEQSGGAFNLGEVTGGSSGTWIVSGTPDSIPEPTSLILSLGSAAFLCLRRHRRTI